MQVLYLHGFASSPQSSKATFLSRKFTERGIRVIVPDLNFVHVDVGRVRYW